MSIVRITGTDVLRGIAALGVVGFHVLYISGIPVTAISQFIFGRFDFFVRVFFVLSAFTMMYSYRDRLSSLNDIKIFYVKRAFRILPLFYFMISLGILTNLCLGRTLPKIDDLVLSISFLFILVPGKESSLVGGGWSLGVEMFFYLLFPILFIFLTSIKRVILTFFVTLFVAIYMRDYFSNVANGSFRTFGLLFPLAHLQYFIIGILIFFIRDKFSSIFKAHASKVFVGSIFLTIFTFKALDGKGEEVFLSILTFALVMSSTFPLSKYIDNRITRYLGEISYSLYLTQFPVIFFLKDIGLYSAINGLIGIDLVSFLFSTVATISCVIFTSCITYKFVEKPFTKVGRKLKVIDLET